VPTAAILDLFKQTTADLLWSSESDYPFEIVTWERGVEMTPTALFNKIAPDLPIEQITLAELFAPVLTVEDWYEADELAQLHRYTELRHAIETNLTDVAVFHVGEVEIAIYIIGKTPDDDVVGLKTYVVET
jgi:Nuclease A inhibitor-like protein